MVFESIVVDVLNRVLGDYVENLDSKQLSIGIWGGDVVLNDLVLKQTALEDLNLPIQIVYGRLGKLVLKIPWKNLYGAPVEAVIERLYLLVVPNLQVKYDSEKEEKIEQSSKQADLLRIENAKKKEAEQGKVKADDTFAEKLTTQIIKNVQVKIKDIHIRYEDSVANPIKPFAFGITLSNLCIETTDDQWRAAIVNDAASKIFKVLNLDALAVYLNCNCSIYSKMSIKDILSYMSDGIATRDSKPLNYAYVLGPINSSARLRLNPKPENDKEPFSVSKVLLNLEMEKLALGISKNQYQDIMCLADSMGRMNRGLPYRKYRPFVNSYKSHYKQWWHFAYTCVLEEEVRRRRRNWDWTHIQKHRTLCKNYALAYQAKLQNKKIPTNVQQELDHTEKKLDLFNLVIIRQRIELEVARLNKKTEEQKAKGSWFSGWWGKPANSEDAELSATADIMKQFQEAMTPQEKAKLFRAIDYQENSAPAEYPETFVATNCAFVLRSLEIEIRDDSLAVPRVLSTTLKGVNCRLQQRPAAKGLKVAVKIDEFTVYGLQQKEILPQLVSSDHFEKDSVLLDVLFEMNPLDKLCDQRLHIKSLPVKVVYDAQTIIKVGDVFKAQQSLTLDELQAATANKIADFKEMSALGLQHAVEKHVVMDLDINLSAPYIIIPHNGLYHDPKSLLIINLGNVKMRSVVRDLEAVNVQKMHREGTHEDDILKELMSQSYDKFQIELSDMQILIANAGEDWGTCITEHTITPMHLLQPVNLIVNVNKCLVTDDPRLPKLKINGQLPSIMLNICDDRVLAVISLLTSIPSSDSIEIQPAPLNNLVAKASVLSLHNTEYQAKKRNEHIQRAQDLGEELIQATDLELKFEMKELVVTVCNRVFLTSAKIMQFRCMSLEVDMIQQTFNTEVILRLGGIGLTHFRPQNTELQIISTPMTSGQDEYLFSVNFLQVNKSSPEFHAKYGSCEQQLQFNFTSLSLLLHQESIQELMHLANDFQKSLERITNQEGKDRISTSGGAPKLGRQLSVIEEFSTKTKQSGTSIKPRRYHGKMVVVETILFKLVANMGEFDILMSNDKHQVASFAIKGVNTSIIMKKSYTAIKATLTDLNIFDCNPKSIHSKILCKTVNEEDALNAKIVLFNNEVRKRDMVDADISVVLQLSGIKITFLNLFVSTVLDFLNKFQAAQQKIIDASAAAAEQAKNNLQSAYENASKIDMNIKLKAPVIIIPTNSTSYDAIMIDLGNIELTNNFLKLEIQNEIGKTALIDDLTLQLLNMKISRVLLNKHLDKKHECTILKPLSLSLNIKRNLSAAWYNMIPNIDIAGKVKSIHLNISDTDYAKIMQVLSENLSEKKDVQVSKIEDKGRRLAKRISVDLITEHKVILGEIPEEKPHTALRFTFTMESMVVSLFKSDNQFSDEEQSFTDDDREGLARFTLLVLSIKGRILSDNSMSTSILLVDCLLDDTRSGHKGNITRLMERKENDELIGACNCVVPTAATSYTHDTLKSMIDITYQQKGNDMFADVRVYSFNLILSIDYLMKIAAFFSINENYAQDPEISNIKTQKAVSVSVKSKQDNISKVTPSIQEETKSMTLNLKVEKPDIILVERMDNIDTNALILNNEIVLNVRMIGRNQSIRGSITDLQLYTCCFNPAKRHETKNPVLHPCNINVIGSTPVDKGLHIDIGLTDIRLSVSPAVIELLSQCQRTMTGSDAEAAENTNNVIYYHDIWDQKPFLDSDYWFLKTEQGQDALESMSFGNRGIQIYKELCNISALSIVVTIEAGVGTNTLPMLLLETSFEANVRNWSSKLCIESSLSMQMAYYNSRLAVWEPLIEPVEVMLNDRLVHTPWTLKIELKKNEQEEQGTISPQSDNDIEEIAFTQPTISILVSSSVNLEIVVTKTLLDVLTNLGKAFQNAVKVGIPIKDADTAPYKVVNDSGLKVTLNLGKSHFMLYNKGSTNNDYKEIVLESGAQVKLDLTPDNEQYQLMNKKSASELKSTKHLDKSLTIFVHDMNCTLLLPIVRADKRYFPLNYRGENNDSWGLISDIAVQGAETIITLRSMLQVHNHFNQPVNVYYMTNRGNELESIKQVPPNTSINLPMHGVYTLTNELFFSVEGHSVTAIPYVWKDLQHNLSMAKTLTCPAGTNQSQQPFVMKVCGDIEQIYYENTSKHTMASTCYNIHLRPAVTFKNCLPIPVICLSQGIVDECVVNPGEQLNLPTVNPGSSYMVIRLSNYLEKEWSCRHDILSNIAEFSVWQFDSHDSLARMSLDLGVHCENKSGTMILSLYCPFWMINKTNLMLSYRNSDECVNILHHPEDFKGPILFSFAAKNFFGKKKAAIRVKNGEWSDKFSLDVAGSSGMVVCKADGVIHQIGVHNQLTYNGLTKQVTFTPYFVLINNTLFEIECQELERPADPWVKVEINSCKPLWPRSERDDKLLKLRIHGTTEISAPFLFTEVHTTLLKLPNKYGGVNIDVQVTEGGIYITFTPYAPGLAPALIINHSNMELSLWEKESVNVKRLKNKHRLLHTWENPTGPRLLLWETGKKKEIEDDLRKDGLGEFCLVEDKRIYWVSFLDGMQRILLFTEDIEIARDAQSAGDLENIQQEITVSIHGLGISLVNNIIRQELLYIGIASSGIIWETCKMNSKRYKQLSMKESTIFEAAYNQYLVCDTVTEPTMPIMIDPRTEVDFQQELMFRPHKRKIRRSFQTGLWLQMKTSPNQMQLHAKINRVQIDNQMYDCIFPVILAPVPPPKSVAADSALKPFAELSIVQRIMKHSTVQQYKYFKVLIQEFHIKVDLGFVNALMAMFSAEQKSESEEVELFIKDMSLVDEPLLAHVSTQSLQEQKNFYDLLHFSPLKIHVSFSLAAPSGSSGNGGNQVSSSNTPAFLNVLLQGLGVTLTDMQDVVFRLAYFEREYSFLTQKQLSSEATSHYVGQFVKQLYVLVLGLDVIGNPYGLVLGISKGVEDLFYEPFQGAIQGPGEFAEGLVLGVRSLFGHTVGGAAGAVSRITGAMGKGIAALTFDKDYQRKRRDQINKKPANIQEGIARGGKGLVMGVVDGVTGVFTKPVRGAKEQGVEGFFKGLGKGAVGLVTRPTAGVIDFASGSLDAVKRATEMGNDVTRLRAPRFMRTDGLVRPYMKQEAEGNKLLTELEKGKYANTDIYAYHTWIVQDKDILLLTDKRLAYVVHNDIFGGWQMEWAYTWKEVHQSKVVDRGVQITASEPKKKVLGLFGSSEQGKIIIIGDPTQRNIVRDKIEELRVNANMNITF